jgi:hypothetical protein
MVSRPGSRRAYSSDSALSSLLLLLLLAVVLVVAVLVVPPVMCRVGAVVSATVTVLVMGALGWLLRSEQMYSMRYSAGRDRGRVGRADMADVLVLVSNSWLSWPWPWRM